MSDVVNMFKDYAQDNLQGKVPLWIPVVVGALITIIGEFLFGAFFPAAIVALGAIAVIKTGLVWGIVSKPKVVDYGIIASFGVVIFLIYIGMLGYVFTRVSLAKLIFAGVVADAIIIGFGYLQFKFSKILKPVENILAIISSLLIFFAINFILADKVAGFIMGTIGMVVSLTPYPLTTVSILAINYGVDRVAKVLDNIRVFFI